MKSEDVIVAVENGEDGYLSHYGVKGMRWGHRKDDRSTGKRRSSSVKGAKKVGKFSRFSLKRLGSKAASAIKKSNDKYKEKRQASLTKKLEQDRVNAAKVQMRELRSKDARRQRQVALTTHDPKELVKYQHLLSDSELKSRYDRLKLEGDVKKLNTIEKADSFKTFKQRADWAMSSPIGKAAINVVSERAMSELGMSKQAKKLVDDAIKTAREATNRAQQAEEELNRERARNSE